MKQPVNRRHAVLFVPTDRVIALIRTRIVTMVKRGA